MAVNILNTKPETTDSSVFVKGDKKTEKNDKEFGGINFSSLFSILLSDGKKSENVLKDFFDKDLKTFKDDFNKDKDVKLSLGEFFNFIYFVKNDQKEFRNSIVDFDKLKSILQDKKVLNEFKNAKNLKELFSLAEKHGIKIESFNSQNLSETAFKKELKKLGLEDIFSPKKRALLKPLKSLEFLDAVKTFRREFKEPLFIKEKIFSNKNIEKFEDKFSKNSVLSSLIKSVKTNFDKKTSSSFSKKTENFDEILTKNDKTENIFKGFKRGDFLQRIEPKKEIQNTDFLSEIFAEKEEKENQKEDIGEIKDILHQSDKSIKKEVESFSSQKVEVKKTFKSFAEDFMESVKNYKPPITKVNLTLNPKNLGEVEVTLFHRKDNLHVVVNANQNALSLFIQNQNEFKNALLNIGFGSFSMNFSDNSGSQHQHQNHRQNEKLFENSEEENKSEISSFEFIVPRYI